MPNPNPNTVKILGINFSNSLSSSIVQKMKAGGLLVVPSGPGLADVTRDHDYYYSLLSADCVLADSGYMALIWNLTHKKKINRVSGLEFLTDFFADGEVKASRDILLVDPNAVQSKANRIYLNKIGFSIDQEASYVAPMYDKNDVRDDILLQIAAGRRPKIILINIGGGIQEKLGRFLKEELNYRPTIICTGAAIAFLTGHQAHIPQWADRLFIGWLFRCIEKPGVYIPRYFSALKLMSILLRYDSDMPSGYLKPMVLKVEDEYLSIE